MQYHTTRSGADPVILNLHRFKEDKGEIAALRTKEQGDWKKLTVEEKKVNYNHIRHWNGVHFKQSYFLS